VPSPRGFQIDDLGLTVSAPRWRACAIEETILEKERWIRSKLAQWQDWRARHARSSPVPTGLATSTHW
jgi:predicted metal-dependent hydrolase